MTSPGGQEVGRVSIRVVPDTSKFRRQLEKELKAIRNSVSVSIPVELDMKKSMTQIAQIRRQLSSMKGTKLDLGVDGSVAESTKAIATHARSIRGALVGAAESARNLASKFQSITSSVAGSVRGVTAFRDQVRQIRDTNLDNSSSARFFKDMQKGSFLDPSALGRFRSSLGGLSATFTALRQSAGSALGTIRDRVIDSDLRFTRLRKSAALFGTAMGKSASVLGKGLAAPLTMMTSAFGNLSRTGLKVVSTIGAIPAILGLIGGLMAGLPSLMLAFGAAAGVVGLGMEGIKTAWQEFIKGIEPLRQAVSQVFKEGLTPQFQEWARVLVTFTPQLKAIASGLIDMTQGFTNAITSAEGMSNINVLLTNTATFFSQLKGPVETFTSAFLQLAAEGSKHFGLLVGVFTNFANGFKTLVADAAASGRLKAALEGLAQVTDSLLQGFLKLFNVGIDAMGQLGGPLAEAFTSIIDLLVQLMPILTPFLGLFLELASTIATALAPAFKELAPLFQLMFQTIGSLLIPIIQALVPPLTALVKFALELFQAFSPLFPVLTTIAKIIGGILTTALNALRPVLPVIAGAMERVAEVINTALAAATPVLNQIAEALGKALADAINALAPVIPQLVDAFLKFFQAILPLLPPLIELVSSILPPLVRIFTELYLPMMEFTTGIVDFLVPAIRWLIDIITIVVGWLGDVGVAIAETGASIMQWFMDLPGKIWGWVKDAGKWLWNTGKDVIQGLWNGMIDKWNGLVRWIEDRGRDIANFFKNMLGINSPSRVFMDIGHDIMAGLRIGIDNSAPDALRAAAQAARDITDLGTGMSADITANGGLQVVGDNIGGQIEDALSNWSVDINKYGVGKLNKSAERDNTYGR